MKKLLTVAAVLLCSAAFADDKMAAAAPAMSDADMAMMQKAMSPEMKDMKAARMMKISEMTGMMASAMEMNAKGMKDKAMKDHLTMMAKENKTISASAKKISEGITKSKDMKMP